MKKMLKMLNYAMGMTLSMVLSANYIMADIAIEPDIEMARKSILPILILAILLIIVAIGIIISIRKKNK